MFKDRQRTLQFLRFCTVGVGNTVVDFTAFWLLNIGGVPYLLAQVLSYSAGVVNSFIFNRKWTFGVTSKANGPEVAKFIIVNGLALLVSSALLFIFHNANHLNLWLAKFAATGGSIVVNFIGSRLWVFTEKQIITGDDL
jgi:putative flippase GtrA